MRLTTNELTIFKNINELNTTNEAGFIKGYASVFGSVDEIGDTILESAFDNVLNSKYMPAMFFNHQS